MKKLILILILFVISFIGIMLYLTKTDEFSKVIIEDDITNYNYSQSEIYVDNDGKKIYGVLYRPLTDTKVPLIIYSHGLGGNYTYGTSYTEYFVKLGYAVYTFDFCGGSSSSKSDGKTTEMSVSTEVSDLESVLKTLVTWGFIDTNNITLFGTSQGGLVSALVSAKNEDLINGLVLFYPAFMITDDIHTLYPSKNDIPSTTNYLGWINVGKNYMLDIYDLDFYNEVKDYDKPVLIVHGTDDSVVDIKYSKKLNETYSNSSLKIINGAGHGFYGNDFDLASLYILDYLKNIERR